MNGQRDINELLDMDYSDMTNEEIERVVEWKSEQKANDAKFQAMLKQQREIENEKIAIMQKESETNIAVQNTLLQAATERLKRASQ